jgi:uracil-DNA glycosylase family 4
MENNQSFATKEKIIPSPDFTLPPPEAISKTGPIRGHTGVTFVAGEGDKPSDIMFVASCLSVQEASKFLKDIRGGESARVVPRFMRSDANIMLKDIFASEAINMDNCYYTAVIKWLLPKNERIKIPKDKVQWALPALEKEIQEAQPKIIVCMGKFVFDLLSNSKLAMGITKSGWFTSEKYNCKLYLIDDAYKLVTNPEYIEKFRVEAREIKRMDNEIKGINVNRVPLHYETITNTAELRDVVRRWREGNFKVLSVDCEWAGNNHIDGKLRSTQFCWAPGHACYIRWMDDAGNYVFDSSYKEAGAIISEWADREDVKYIGHHFAADAPWMHHVLGLNWYEKCIFDTEFAQQTANEAEDLSLERIALKYTDLGRYDLELALWVKQNRALMVDGGYGAIPDSILIPYAMKDVDTVFRAWPIIRNSLIAQDLFDYYNDTFHPFVTDVFISFSVVGLPMDVQMMDELRVLYSFARDKMEKVLQEEIHAEAKSTILNAFADRLPIELAVEKYSEFMSILASVTNGEEHTTAWALLKSIATKPDEVPRLKATFDHFLQSSNFNIRSAPHLKRWLFDVKGYTPIKSTSKKEQGMPATSWEKVLSMPPDVRKQYNPAVDKQTLQILAEQENDQMLRKLLQLNAVGNICKAFLKEADVDDEGNLVKENGLHFFLCSDNCVHGQMSTTETGRPRSWKPNSLNWPSYVNGMISKGITSLFVKLKARNELPEAFEQYLIQDDKGEFKCSVPSIRSCVKAPPGWCFVESDYQTAEIRGLAFISGDQSLIDIVCKPDLNFAISIYEENGEMKEKKVRLAFPADVFTEPVKQKYEYLIVDPSDPSLKKDSEGRLKHPKQDLHWSLAEMVHVLPREVLDEKKDRGAAKVGNFSSAYGASPSTLERKIEQDTGIKPAEGTGDRLLKMLEKRQPIAQEFLVKMERIPAKSGVYRAASGRLRHFTSHGEKYMDVLDEHLTSGLFKSMGREARNFPMQESVAATAARAGKWLLDAYIKGGMKARPLIILYDSVVTLCPLAERFKVADMHQKFMTDDNTWKYHGTTMNYPIDTDFVYRWSSKPTKAEIKLLNDKTYLTNE